MCSVSAVMEYGQRLWPNTLPVQPNVLDQTVWPPGLNVTYGPAITVPALDPTAEREAILRFMKLVDAAREFDKVADQADCEDPEKIKVLGRIEARLAAIEERLGIEAA